MNQARPGKHVLVTGCSSGIGRMCAQELAKQGWNVIAGVRQPADVLSLQREISANLTAVILDITSSESVQSACQTVAALTGDHGLDGLVNNAGILVPGPLELISPQKLQMQFDVNVFGTHRLTQELLPQLRLAASSKNQTSRLVLVSSISGRISPPYFGAYAASKHALEAMGEAWRSELSPWQIAVSVVQPDSVATPIWDKACTDIDAADDGNRDEAAQLYASTLRNLRRQSLINKRAGLSTQVVVRSILHSLNHKRPKPYYRVGWRTRAAFWAHSLLPTNWMDVLLRRSVGG